ncbi:hypothetical protein [Streptomyces sp. NPDC048603]|uniref:hypothetical protein n=1 Tax=Streptomyces sp. NPDC048603 TaxID=3365577 RepID=UPI00371A3805
MKFNHSHQLYRLRILRSVFAAAAAALTLTTAIPAAAQTEPEVELRFDKPQVSENAETVSWPWTVTNGTEPVEEVMLRVWITPELKIVKVSAPCTLINDLALCEYGRLKPGETRTGTLVAELPADTSGTLKPNGRLNWQPESSTPDAAETS